MHNKLCKPKCIAVFIFVIAVPYPSFSYDNAIGISVHVGYEPKLDFGINYERMLNWDFALTAELGYNLALSEDGITVHGSGMRIMSGLKFYTRSEILGGSSFRRFFISLNVGYEPVFKLPPVDITKTDAFGNPDISDALDDYTSNMLWVLNPINMAPAIGVNPMLGFRFDPGNEDSWIWVLDFGPDIQYVFPYEENIGSTTKFVIKKDSEMIFSFKIGLRTAWAWQD